VDDDKVMLCLAALTYRGFGSVLPQSLPHTKLPELIAAGLAELSPLEKRWKLAWGPATYRAATSLFDDAMMFVAHDEEANRFAIAVRGTNPVSVFDWLFGDLWVCEQVPWPYGAPSHRATISLSTALGLEVLQLAESEPTPAFARPNGASAETRTVLNDAFSELPADVGAAVGETARSFLSQIRAEGGSPGGLAELAQSWQNGLARHAHLSVLQLLKQVAELRARVADGQTLLDFLRGAVASSPAGVEIAVTGHSKAGAVAPALALWLAEGQHFEGAQPTVSCWAFAGPSPGNHAFRDRFHDAFEDRFHRIENPLDLVPKAWESGTLATLPGLYGPGAPCDPALSRLIRTIHDRMKKIEGPEGNGGYAHLRGASPADWNWQPHRDDDFLAQVIHHHLDGYFIAAGLDYRVADFFDPLADLTRPAPRG
jgi:hypothetical protein